MIQKPQRSCLLTPDKEDLFYGKIFANKNGFLNEELKNEYNHFMTHKFQNYNLELINFTGIRDIIFETSKKNDSILLYNKRK